MAFITNPSFINDSAAASYLSMAMESFPIFLAISPILR